MTQDEALSREQMMNVYLKIAMDGWEAWCARRGVQAPPVTMGSFLQHVLSTVPFYKNRMENINGTPELSQFPVIGRHQFRSQANAFRSSEFLEESERFFAHTNGTVASKLRVHFDLASWYDFNYSVFERVAETMPNILSGLQPGELAVLLMTESSFDENMSVILPSLGASIWQRVIVNQNEEEDRALLTAARASSIPLLYGKASSLVRVANLENQYFGDHQIKPRAILVSGENLYDDHREILERCFSAPVYNAYIATEGSLIAMECDHHTGLHVANWRNHLEILDDDGKITDVGTGDVLLTHLFNWAHSFVRYQLGDRATIQHVECPCGFTGQSITEIFGREEQSFESTAGSIDCNRFASLFRSIQVSDYEVTQVQRNRFTVKWVPADWTWPTIGATNSQITRALADQFEALEFEIIPVHQIRTKSGKLRRFLSSIDSNRVLPVEVPE